MAKKNTQESSKDVTTFSSRIHSKPKRSAKNDKRMGGGKPSGKPQRPGKTKRANNKNRARNKWGFWEEVIFISCNLLLPGFTF